MRGSRAREEARGPVDAGRVGRYLSMGSLAMNLDQLPAAVTEIEQNIDFLLHLPDHALHGKHRSELLQAHLWLARIHQVAGDRDAAERALRAGVALADKFLAGRPGETGWEVAGLKLRIMLGNVLAAKGEAEAAVAVLRPAIVMADHLASLGPAEDLWEEDVDDPHYVLGIVLMEQGDLSEDALRVHRKAYAYAERRHRETPGDADQGWLLFQLCLYRSALLLRAGERAGAEEAYARAAALADRLPVVSDAHRRLKGMLAWAGGAEEKKPQGS